MYKLILVDDETEITNGLKNYFPWHDIGFEVVGTFNNGKQAFDFLKSNAVDVALVDIKMPGMDGIELVRRLREMKIDAFFVLISGYKEFEYAKSALELGVKNYIVKPTKYHQLCDIFTKLRIELDQKYSSMNNRNVSDDKPDLDNINTQIISKIKKYVELNYRDVTLEKTAEHVRLNPYYLSSFFHQHTGEKFYDYVLSVKMRKAAKLLCKTGKKIYEISELVGYSNPNSFSRTFKNFYSLNPRKYRIIYGSEENNGE